MHGHSLTERLLRIIAVTHTSSSYESPMCWVVRILCPLASTWWKVCKHPRHVGAFPQGTLWRFQLCSIMTLWSTPWVGLISQASLTWEPPSHKYVCMCVYICVYTYIYTYMRYVYVYLCTMCFLLSVLGSSQAALTLGPSVLRLRAVLPAHTCSFKFWESPTLSRVLPMESWFNAHNHHTLK